MDNACNHITTPVKKRFMINSVDNLGFPSVSSSMFDVGLIVGFDVVGLIVGFDVVGLIVGFEVEPGTDKSLISALIVTPSNNAIWFSKPAATVDAAALTASTKLVAPLLSENDAVNMRSKLTSSMRRPRRLEEFEHVRSSTDASVSFSAVVKATQVDPFTASSSSEHMTSWSSSVVVMLSVPLAVDTDVSLIVGPGVELMLELIVGLTVGLLLEVTVGLIVGLPVELMLELIVGLNVGLLLEFTVGLIVGLSVGLIVGLNVGNNVGLVVGLIVGLSVGLIVGLNVGNNVGLVVGLIVGLVVGLNVGLGVGQLSSALLAEPQRLFSQSESSHGMLQASALQAHPPVFVGNPDSRDMLLTVAIEAE